MSFLDYISDWISRLGFLLRCHLDHSLRFGVVFSFGFLPQ